MAKPLGDIPISIAHPEFGEPTEDEEDLAAAEAALARIAAGAKPVLWHEVKRRADEVRRAAGHHLRTDAERAEAQRHLDDGTSEGQPAATRTAPGGAAG